MKFIALISHFLLRLIEDFSLLLAIFISEESCSCEKLTCDFQARLQAITQPYGRPHWGSGPPYSRLGAVKVSGSLAGPVLHIFTYLHSQSQSLHSYVSLSEPLAEVLFRSLCQGLLGDGGETLKILRPTLTSTQRFPLLAFPRLALPPMPEAPSTVSQSSQLCWPT